MDIRSPNAPRFLDAKLWERFWRLPTGEWFAPLATASRSAAEQSPPSEFQANRAEAVTDAPSLALVPKA
jgi:hypothetical protein